jgi:hypothetical protein
LRTCYLLGTPAQIRDRIAELAAAGLEYLMRTETGDGPISAATGTTVRKGRSTGGSGAIAPVPNRRFT